LIEQRGHVGDGKLQAFLNVGFTQRQALEVIVGLSLKVLSNYTNALARTELDAPVKKFAWFHP
jgi:alkylhydroperoxidase family enzyme